eukprot:UN23884
MGMVKDKISDKVDPFMKAKGDELLNPAFANLKEGIFESFTMGIDLSWGLVKSMEKGDKTGKQAIGEINKGGFKKGDFAKVDKKLAEQSKKPDEKLKKVLDASARKGPAIYNQFHAPL